MRFSSLLFWKNNRKGKNTGEQVSPAKQSIRDFLNMSAREHKKMMKKVIREASEDQMKILRQ